MIRRVFILVAALLLGAAPALAQSGRPFPPTSVTLGSTVVTLGTTATTITGLILSDGTLAGTTVLPGSGQITASGEVGILGSPTTLFQVGGTYINNAASSLMFLSSEFQSSQTSALNALNLNPTLVPTGASITSIIGLNSLPVASIGSLALTNFFGYSVVPSIKVGSSGAIANVYAYNAGNISNSGTSVVSGYGQFRAALNTNGDGITSGSVTNYHFIGSGITSGAAGGTVNNRAMQLPVPSGGASSGTTNNRGLYITGNGGAASGSGTVNNFAIYSDSTANSRLLGFLGLGGDPSAQLHLQGDISAAAWTTNGIRIRGGGSTLTDTSSSGTVAAAYTNGLGGNTIAASSATTFTNYYGLYASAPVAGSNVTFTNGWALGADTARIATTLRLAGPATDAGHTTATVCRDTTTGNLETGSGAASICLGTSSARFKHDIAPLRPGLAQIAALRPVSYRYNAGYGDSGARTLYGFTAEQVAEVMPELVGYDVEGRPQSVDWAGMVPVLVRAVQELREMRR